MKRVIDISEDAYELLLEKGTCGKFANLGEIVANSTSLEQEPCDKYIKEIDHLRKYIYKLETQIVEQEPMVEIDLYSVIKQKYIEREALKNEIMELFFGDGREEYFDSHDSKEYKDGAIEAADYIIKMIDGVI